MGKYIKFFIVGIFFGIVLVKSEAVSWYRIFEMFKFQSFHMYGIIGTAVITGIILLLISKQIKVKNIEGSFIRVPLKERGFTRYIIGGTIFGLGWALMWRLSWTNVYFSWHWCIFNTHCYCCGIIRHLCLWLLKDKLPH